ncbi:(2Fe-2S)-binding protein [Robertmurraya massiliosenegalensis]|uniref:(2Fe-2S)-binding protein n=1 Tax=Robertmurraya massiliosenegalensis TaxID=1287657 RepID=UPI00031EECA0|nr:(2Fe-2S)-binding protein [Robertmurraya massiliosenegalensis]
MSNHHIKVGINGKKYESVVNSRMHLADYLREDLNLTGTHLGCEHGVCGACTILLDGKPVRSCTMLAVQADGHNITTVEGLSCKNAQTGKTELSNVQKAFWECHGLQCGFCTPGMLLTAQSLLNENPDPHEKDIRESLSGNICRCTGYVQIIESVKLAAKLNRNEQKNMDQDTSTEETKELVKRGV